MSTTMNKSNAMTYGWRCAALVATAISTKATFEAVAHRTNAVKRTAPGTAHAAVRVWDGPIT